MCVIFIMSSLAYFRLQQHINISTDVIGDDKQKNMKYIKDLVMWTMIGAGVLVLLCGYDLLYTEGADKYLGGLKKECGCNASAQMTDMSKLGMFNLAGMDEF